VCSHTPHCPAPFCTAPLSTALHHSAPFCTAPPSTALHHSAPFCTAPPSTALPCTALLKPGACDLLSEAAYREAVLSGAYLHAAHAHDAFRLVVNHVLIGLVHGGEPHRTGICTGPPHLLHFSASLRSSSPPPLLNQELIRPTGQRWHHTPLPHQNAAMNSARVIQSCTVNTDVTVALKSFHDGLLRPKRGQIRRAGQICQ